MLPFDNLDEIHDVLKKYPGLSAGIGMEKAMLFVRLATRLKDEILSKQKPEHNPDEPPDTLPANAQEFLGRKEITISLTTPVIVDEWKTDLESV